MRERFFELNATHPGDAVEAAWNIVSAAYQESHRHYHTLNHLADLFRQMDQVKPFLKNAPVVAMAIFYHDVVYQPGSPDNEERSAIMATEAMQHLGWKERDVREVAAYIRSTRNHLPDAAVLNGSDLEAFLDMDLSILGSDWETYRAYSTNILRELGNNAMVKWGRSAFMQRFLERPIYRTAYFREKFDAFARQNIRREINELLR